MIHHSIQIPVLPCPTDNTWSGSQIYEGWLRPQLLKSVRGFPMSSIDRATEGLWLVPLLEAQNSTKVITRTTINKWQFNSFVLFAISQCWAEGRKFQKYSVLLAEFCNLKQVKFIFKQQRFGNIVNGRLRLGVWTGSCAQQHDLLVASRDLAMSVITCRMYCAGSLSCSGLLIRYLPWCGAALWARPRCICKILATPPWMVLCAHLSRPSFWFHVHRLLLGSTVLSPSLALQSGMGFL